jgi:hypothetical protein
MEPQQPQQPQQPQEASLFIFHPASLWSSDSDSDSMPLLESLLGVSWREQNQEQGLLGARKREDSDSDSDSDSDPVMKRRRCEPDEPDPFFMKLSSGEEFYFTEEDGKDLVNIHEPNVMLRNIIADMPRKISNRMRYLAKFNHTEIMEGPRHFENVYDAVIAGYIRECRLRRIFRGVLQRWRIRKMNRASTAAIDPITLSPPEKTVTVYDWATRKRYLFDAKSLATLIDSQLLYNEYGFSVPHMPRNPWTNIEFTYIQLVSMYEQLQHHGELRWGFTTLRSHQFHKEAWELYHRPALTMKAIRASMTLLDTRAAREMLEDFIIRQMEECQMTMTDNILHIYSLAIQHAPNHWYVESFKSLACQFWEAEQFGVRAPGILSACRALFKKQPQFVRELREAGIITVIRTT